MNRTLLPQLFIVITAFTIMVFLGSYFGSQIVNKYINRYGDEIISVSAETIKTYLQSFEITINDTAFIMERMWSGSEETPDFKAEKIAPAMQKELILWFKWLQSHDDRLTEVSSVFGVIGGKYITTSDWTIPDNYRPESRNWYSGAFEAGRKIYCSDPYPDIRTGEYVVTFSKLLFDKNNQPFGVIALDVFISHISDFVARIQLMDSGYGILLDSNHRVIVHPITDFFGISLDGITSTAKKPDPPETVSSASLNPATYSTTDRYIISGYAEMMELLNNSDGMSAYDYKTPSGEKIVIFMRELLNGWHLGFALPSDIYYQDAKVMQAILAITGIILAILLCGVLTFMHIAKSRSDSASRVKSNFLANMSHEIRTPMNAIIGMTELLQHEELTSRQRDYVKDIDTSANSLLSIINDILDLSKIESGKLELSPVNYDFPAMLDNINSMFRYVSQKKELDFRFETAGEIPKILYGDDIRLRQVLTNLCGNAVKYTEKGYIRLKVSTFADKLVFEIKDTGMGIKKESLPGIFNAFEQDKTEKNRHIAGTGLGLPISKAFVEMMGGTIMLDSEYEQGTVITVIIPLVLSSESNVKIENKIESKLSIHAPNASVLLVDDNEFNLKVAHGLLMLHDINAIKAASGIEAINLVKDIDFDIVFMDHMMPEMDGVEATGIIRKLGEKYRNLPIIALTANAVQGAKEMFLLNGFNDFISKPIDPQKLTELLIEWLPKEKIISIKKVDISSDESVKNKILYTLDSTDHKQNTEQLQEAVLINNLSQIEGLDIHCGLAYIGQNRKNYFELLRFFSDNCKTYIKELINAMNEEKWALYTIKVHALKGVLANIGAQNLSNWAAKLEKASKNRNELPTKFPAEEVKTEDGNITTCRDETGAFAEKLEFFQEKLENILTNTGSCAVSTNAAGKVSRGTDQILQEQFRLLNEACVNNSFADTKKILSVLDGYEWDEDSQAKIKQVKQFIASFDYDKAQVFIGQIQEHTQKGDEHV